MVHLFLLFLILLLAAVFRRKEGRTDKRAVGRTTSFSVVNVTFFPQHIFQRRFVFFPSTLFVVVLCTHTLTRKHIGFFFIPSSFSKHWFFLLLSFSIHTHIRSFSFSTTLVHTHTLFRSELFFIHWVLRFPPKYFSKIVILKGFVVCLFVSLLYLLQIFL